MSARIAYLRRDYASIVKRILEEEIQRSPTRNYPLEIALRRVIEIVDSNDILIISDKEIN